MEQQGSLINCKKCGTLFVKNQKDVCDACLKSETATLDKIKGYLGRRETKMTFDELSTALMINKGELESFIERGKLFSVMDKLSIKCRFCGAEVEGDQKNTFVCSRCLTKFNPRGDGPVQQSTIMSEDHKKKLEQKRIRRAILSGQMERYGFIQNYEV